MRSRQDRWLAGVCGGLAEYWGWSPLLVRLMFVILGLHLGVGLLIYLVMALALPLEDGDA